MITWLQTTLQSAGQNDKFIINSHIYAGEYNSPADDMSDGGKPQTFFEKNYTTLFRDLMITHKNKILLVQGAHTHFGDVRSEWGTPTGMWDAGDADYALLSTPAISPVFGNNPGFTTFDYVDGKIRNVEFTFLDLN